MHTVTATRPGALDVEPLAASAEATPTNVGRLRRTLRDWLLPVLDDDPDAADDLVLAVGEALKNAADHAFTGPGPVGSMCVRATDHGRRISIVVSDDGRWRPPDTDPGCRGRGIELMNHLADVTRIEATTVGTAVTLEHHRRLRPAA